MALGIAGLYYFMYRCAFIGGDFGTTTVFLPAAVTLCFGFLTIRMDDTTVLDFIKYAVRYFISTQQYFEWKAR